MRSHGNELWREVLQKRANESSEVKHPDVNPKYSVGYKDPKDKVPQRLTVFSNDPSILHPYMPSGTVRTSLILATKPLNSKLQNLKGRKH